MSTGEESQDKREDFDANRPRFFSALSDGDLQEEGRVLLEIAKAAMVSPSFDELSAAGVQLTDEQLIAIFRFTQLGAKSLDRFREFSGDNDGDIRGAEVSV